MRYSFAPAKQALNLKKHGLDLAEAARVIESGSTGTFEDRRLAYEDSLRGFTIFDIGPAG